MRLSAPRDDPNDRQVFNPGDPGSRIRGIMPLGIIGLKDAQADGRNILVETLTWSVIPIAALRFLATQWAGGFSIFFSCLVVEAVFMTAISRRSANDSRIFGMRDISRVIIVASMIGVIGQCASGPTVWEAIRSRKVQFSLLPIIAEVFIAITLLATAFLAHVDEQPYERPGGRKPYVYEYTQAPEHVRPTDSMPFVIAWLLPLFAAKATTILGFYLLTVIAAGIAFRYFGSAIIESLDIVAAHSSNTLSNTWFHPQNPARHFLFITMARQVVGALILPIVALFSLGHWAAFIDCQVLFLGYNRTQRRASTLFELSPTFESPELRTGLLYLTLSATTVGVVDGIRLAISSNASFEALAIAAGISSAIAFVWAVGLFGAIYGGPIAGYMAKLRKDVMSNA